MARLILMGAPGSGKGTQGEVLSQAFQIPRIAPGDMFRAAVQAGTELGKLVKAYSEAGMLVPDELVIKVMRDRLEENDAQMGWILDGFPRTIPQAEALDQLLSELGQRCDWIINLEVPIPILMERLQKRAIEQNRPDDTPAVIQKRLAEYHAKTLPLLEFYGDRVARIDGTLPIPEVTAQIKALIAGEYQP
ncbi:MAG: adenylate kinase [Pseudanabaenaceae cyanobacterium]